MSGMEYRHSNDTLFYIYKWSLVLSVRLGDSYKLAWAAISCCLNNWTLCSCNLTSVSVTVIGKCEEWIKGEDEVEEGVEVDTRDFNCCCCCWWWTWRSLVPVRAEDGVGDDDEWTYLFWPGWGEGLRFCWERVVPVNGCWVPKRLGRTGCWGWSVVDNNKGEWEVWSGRDVGKVAVCGRDTCASILVTSLPDIWSWGHTPFSLRSHRDCTTTLSAWSFWSVTPCWPRMLSRSPVSPAGGDRSITGSLITPHVRRTGPAGLKGLALNGRIGCGMTCRGSIFFPVPWGLRSRALRLVPSPRLPARLKSKQVKSAFSPKNLAICGFERNFFPQGLCQKRDDFKMISNKLDTHL